MPFENDPLKPPPDDRSGTQGGRLSGGDPKPPPALTPQQILEAEYEQDLTRREQIEAAKRKAAHNSSVKQLYAFIVMFSLFCTSCGLFSSFEYLNVKPPYSEEEMIRRVDRLYLTGYDPIMTPEARASWVNESRGTEFYTVTGATDDGFQGRRIDVVVKRDGKVVLDVFYFYSTATIQHYRANITHYNPHDEVEPTNQVDSSIYPKYIDEIPEHFTK